VESDARCGGGDKKNTKKTPESKIEPKHAKVAASRTTAVAKATSATAAAAAAAESFAGGSEGGGPPGDRAPCCPGMGQERVVHSSQETTNRTAQRHCEYQWTRCRLGCHRLYERSTAAAAAAAGLRLPSAASAATAPPATATANSAATEPQPQGYDAHNCGGHVGGRNSFY